MPQVVTSEELGGFAAEIHRGKYAFDRNEDWAGTARRVGEAVMGAIGALPSDDVTREVVELIRTRKFLPGGRYLYAAGRDFHQVNNCLLLRCEDSREGWAETFWQASMALMTGAGIGIDYSQVRAKGERIARTGGAASGPLSPMRIVNEIGRDIMQGGSRRSAIWAGLNWQHKDVMDFVRLKDWSPEVRALKDKDYTFPAEMELTNISVGLDDEFFAAYYDSAHPRHSLAWNVYWSTVKRMVKTGEPGFSIDTGENAGESLRNACTEVTSRDDSDVCNLGSINLGRIESVEELKTVTELATLFLVAGTVYSHVPYEKVGDVREKNRRLGLGLMGVHEWLLQRGKPYAPDAELGEWLQAWADTADASSARHAYGLSISTPVKNRAIAPNGTIGIIGETTTSIEPVFCVAYKRRYLQHEQWRTDYVIDPVAARLIQQGVAPDAIEDAYSLASDVGRRLDFQAFMQGYVDHGISSTINLPKPLEDERDVSKFGVELMKRLPSLRGVTVYPNGARAGQPIVPAPYEEALARGAFVEGNEDTCLGGICSV